mgnify:CR=1 FL=1
MLLNENKFDEIKNQVQLIIDFIGNKNFIYAECKLIEVRQTLNDLIDLSIDDQ